MTQVQFEKIAAKTWGLNLRQELWINPFWNVYDIFAYARNCTYFELVEPVSIVV